MSPGITNVTNEKHGIDTFFCQQISIQQL